MDNEIINFEDKKPVEYFKPAEQFSEKRNPDNMVNELFEQGKRNVAETNDRLKDKVLKTAEKFIETKMDIVNSEVETEDQAAHFKNHKSACEIFGYDETTTQKWAVSVMAIYHNFLTLMWLIVGFFTYAPVSFIAKKIQVLLKHMWVSILLALLIYATLTLGPIILSALNIKIL